MYSASSPSLKQKEKKTWEPGGDPVALGLRAF